MLLAGKTHRKRPTGNMNVHHLICGTMKPRGAKYLVPHLARVPCNCLVVETGECLVLVDAGLGTRDMEDPGRLGHSNVVLNAQRDPEQTAVRQVARLGFHPRDVRHIVCTHLDRDHAGGLADFPQARVHVSKAEHGAAMKPEGPRERDRYRRCHFAHGPNWVTYDAALAEDWFGMRRIGGLGGLPEGIALVPLPGHTRGHCGVAVETGGGWLLHCGDAYYVRDEIEQYKRTPLGVRCFRRVAHIDHATAVLQLTILDRALKESNGGITLLAAHDPEGVHGVC
jgi:glyoxylase-like metal-dependent hydrolase (beta-lactamase superfamily II)